MTDHTWNPGQLLELSGYYWKTCTLHAAVKLDVFTCLGEEPLSAEKVAKRLNASPRGTERLLNALVAMKLLIKTPTHPLPANSFPKTLPNILAILLCTTITWSNPGRSWTRLFNPEGRFVNGPPSTMKSGAKAF